MAPRQTEFSNDRVTRASGRGTLGNSLCVRMADDTIRLRDVAERIIKASRLCAVRQGGIDRNRRVAQVTEPADRSITLVGGRVRYRTAPPGGRWMWRTRTMAGETRRIRDTAREIVTVAFLAARNTAFGTGPLCPCAM